MLAYIHCGLLLLCLGESLAMSDEMLEMAKMLHDTCVGETGVDESLIGKCTDGVFTEDNNLKCYIKCFMVQIASMTDDGEIDVEAAVGMLPDEMREMAEPVIRGCGTVKGVDDCDTAFQTHKCYYSKNPEAYFLV